MIECYGSLFYIRTYVTLNLFEKIHWNLSISPRKSKCFHLRPQQPMTMVFWFWVHLLLGWVHCAIIIFLIFCIWFVYFLLILGSSVGWVMIKLFAIREGAQTHHHQRYGLWALGESLCSRLVEGKYYLNFQCSRKYSWSCPAFLAFQKEEWKFRWVGPKFERGNRWIPCPLQQKAFVGSLCLS